MCSGSEAGSYLRLLYHSTLGLKVMKKKKKAIFVQLKRTASLKASLPGEREAVHC